MADLLAVSNTDCFDRVADVVFIHGLDGDVKKTWTNPALKDGFWPKWLGADHQNLGIWSVAYDVKSSGWAGYSMSLPDRAKNILDLLVAHGIGERSIIFVVHSFGGLVVKQMLRTCVRTETESWTKIKANTRGIAFLATPHSGARLANWLGWIPLYRHTVTVSELERNNPCLRELGIWFRRFHATSGMAVIVYTETRKFRWFRIVHDGDPNLKAVEAIPLDDDHVSITKPKSRSSQLYRGIERFTLSCAFPDSPLSGRM